MTSLWVSVNMKVPLVASASNQASDIDVPSGYDAVERGDDLLVVLLLTQHEQRRLLRWMAAVVASVACVWAA